MGALHATMNISLDACCDYTQILARRYVHEEISALFERVTALLFDRNTFELLYSHWPQVASSGAGTPAEVRLAYILNEKPKYVVSRQDPASGWSARRIEASVDSIRTLKDATNGMLLLVASATLARTLLEWNLVDEYHVVISPIVSGHGPTFQAGLQREMRATLLSVHQLSSRVVIHRHSFGRN